jgi:putative hydrolase of the HAD superfamily
MKTFVFDADGVLCVGSPFTVALEREHQISRDRLAQFFAGPFSECLLGSRDLKEALEPYLAESGWRQSVDEFLAFWFQREDVVCAAALSCARALRSKGHMCALATNQEKYRLAYLRREMRLAEEFDHIFASCDIGARKPDSTFFSYVGGQLRRSPSELCLIDDSEDNVSAARALGWSAIRYRGTEDLAALETRS